MALPVTSLYTAFLGFYFLALTLRIVKFRRGQKIAIGDGLAEVVRELLTKKGEVAEKDVQEAFKKYSGLAKAVRSHGNFSEYVPFLLFSLGLAELNGAPKFLLHLFGLAILFGRVLHAEFGIQRPRAIGFGRVIGTALTLGSAVLLGVTNLYLTLV